MGERLLARLDAIVHHLSLVRGTNIVPHLSYDGSCIDKAGLLLRRV